MAKVFGYKTYSFVDKDPVIDLLRTVIKSKQMMYKDIAEASGVKAATLSRWFDGDTKRPQHATLVAVARALGYDFRLVPVELLQQRPRLVSDNGNHPKKKLPIKAKFLRKRGGGDAA